MDTCPGHGFRLDARNGRVGGDLTGLSTAARAQQGIARTYQIITLFNRETLVHNVMLAAMGRSTRRWRAWGAFGTDAGLRERAMAHLDAVGLAQSAQLPLQQKTPPSPRPEVLRHEVRA